MPTRPLPSWLLRFLGSLLMLAALSACSSLPKPPPVAPTHAITGFEDTPLARITQAQLPDDGRSGFLLQPYGPNSFATRLALCRLATRSLDVQYYLLQSDHTGRTLMRALRDAAARGVRVRVLVDDLHTAGSDALLLGLAAHPNVELRLFNPFPSGRGHLLTRFISSGLDIGRVDRRMHNKLFVADNVAAVAGGRNIADEYMVNAEGSNFIDMDTFVAGPAVRELSRAFDLYWNSEHVYPVDQIAFSPLSPEQRRAQFDRLTANTHPPTDTGRVPDDGQVAGSGLDLPFDQLPPALVRMLNLPYDLAEGRLGPLLQAQARVLVDPLSKTEGVNEHEHSITGTVFEGTYQWFTTSRQLLRMTSPYFVPDDTALQSLAHARQQGVRLQLVTNALAATDEPWVHVGYSRQRQALLKMGVEIFEISPSLSAKRRRLGVIGKSLSALHMKSAILDHRQVFLGSMNLDPRSVRLNTELGLIIDSPEMAAQLEAMSDLASVYQLRLGADGHRIEWIERDGEGHETVHLEEPETSPWLRFKLWLLGPLVPVQEL